MKWVFAFVTATDMIAGVYHGFDEQYARAAWDMSSATLFLIFTLYTIEQDKKEE